MSLHGRVLGPGVQGEAGGADQCYDGAVAAAAPGQVCG